MTDVMTRVDVAAEIRLVPYAYLRLFGHPPAVVTPVPGGLCLLAGEDAALAVTVPWGAAVAGSPRDDGVLELRSRNRPAETVTVRTALPEEVPDWAEPAIRAVARLRAAGHGAGGATMVVHTGLPASLAVPSAAAVEAATARAMTEMYGLPTETAVPVGPPAPGSAAVADRAAVLAALAGHPTEAVLVRSDATVDRLPFDLVAAGLRLLIVEPGKLSRDVADGPHRGPGTGLAGLAEHTLRRGDLTQLGPLLTAASADGSPPALATAAEAATAAGALGAGPVGDPSNPALAVLLRYSDLARIRAAVRAALPAASFRPHFLTATPTAPR